MAIDWKRFTRRPYIQSLSLEEQIRLFQIANEKSIKLREQRYVDFANSNSTSQGAAGDGYEGVTFTNKFSLDFDGTDAKVTFSTITLATDYTLSAWAKRASTANMFLLGNEREYGYGAYFYGTSKLYFKEENSTLMTFNNAAIQTALARTDWVHWSFVKDATAGTVSIYVDGVLAQSLTGTGMATINAIGGSGHAAGTQYIWNGNIDEVAIWGSALTQAQITKIYNTGYAGDLSSLSPVAWYRFEEGSGTTAIDAGSGGNNGTINGATYSTDVPI